MRSGEAIDNKVDPTSTTFFDRIGAEEFRDWYTERQFVENIRNGQAYFNGPAPVKPPERHSPSSLLQCHRKIYYNQRNAPEESADPHGIFWFGSRFEEELAVPFLQNIVANEDAFVTNSLWIDFSTETEAATLQIRGETDPVIVDEEGKPLLLFEIKTKRTVKNLTEPNRHHKAQAHAYMRGLSEKYDRAIDESIIIYGGRTTLNLKTFRVTFDEEFWNDTVLNWAENHTVYRLEEELPPADPEYDWECEFCSFRERCGKGSESYDSAGPLGLLPRYEEYPRQKLVEYLEAHNAALLPSLAQKHPDLAKQYGVCDWYCDTCESGFSWEPDNRTSPTGSRLCPSCAETDRLSYLMDPPLDVQQAGIVDSGGNNEPK